MGGYSIAAHSLLRYVLYFGRYTEEKGIRMLLKTAEEMPEIRFIFVGRGPLENELFKTKLHNVVNLGFKSGIELTQLIAHAQFVVVPSKWYEPFGLSIIESMQLGTPVIGSNTGGIPELIKDGVNGLIFESGCKEELVEKIRLLWNSPERIKMLSHNCIETKIVSIEEYGERLIKEVYIQN